MMFAIPSIGNRISVTVSWADSRIARQNQTTERAYVGVVVKNNIWDEPNTFNVFTGVSYHPISNIVIERVTDLVYTDSDKVPKTMTAQQAKAEYGKQPDQEWTVKGSKGDTYIITRRNNQYMCPCKGFGYRGKCGHIDEIKKINGL